MKIIRSGARASILGRADWFQGRAWYDDIAVPVEPSRIHFLEAHFEPGARTAWHSHPLGQTLHVTSGVGRVQKAGEAVQEIRPGDTILIAPNERHWHGAAPAHGVAHLAVHQTAPDGTEVSWFEHVSESEYNAAVQG